jgi:hypothetical protein
MSLIRNLHLYCYAYNFNFSESPSNIYFVLLVLENVTDHTDLLFLHFSFIYGA